MTLSGAMSGMLSAWLVGPLYGVNVVTVIFIMRRLWPRRANGLFRILMLVTAILICSCTAHSFIYLDDLIRGFDSSDLSNNTEVANLDVNDYFLQLGRFNLLACFVLYLCNSFCNNIFVTWRVYVTWNRNFYLATVHTMLSITVLVTIGVVCHRFANHGSLLDPTIRAIATSGWASALIVQTTGGLLIAWRTLQTPQVVDNGDKRTSRVPQTLFYACVESGCLSVLAECVLLAYMYRDIPVAFIILALLGQISAFSSFAIILRELQKADIECKKGFVNVTSALAMHDLPRRRARRSINSLEDADGPGATVVVRIETSRHADDTLKAVSISRSWDVGQVILK